MSASLKRVALGYALLLANYKVFQAEHDEAQAMLRSRYPQLRSMQISDRPVIALRIERTTSWGDLSGGRSLPTAGLERASAMRPFSSRTFATPAVSSKRA